MFFGEGRRALLEFLRNLTPQILFMTLAIVLGAKLDMSHFDFSPQGIKNAGPFVMCIIVFMGAAIANTTLFIDAAITSNESLDNAANEIKEMQLKALPRTWHLACAAWRFNKPAFVQLALALIITEAAIVAIFLLAIQGALASPLLH